MSSDDDNDDKLKQFFGLLVFLTAIVFAAALGIAEAMKYIEVPN